MLWLFCTILHKNTDNSGQNTDELKEIRTSVLHYSGCSEKREKETGFTGLKNRMSEVDINFPGFSDEPEKKLENVLIFNRNKKYVGTELNHFALP